MNEPSEATDIDMEPGLRVLNHSSHIANRRHWCDYGNDYIEPGQIYLREVYLDFYDGRVYMVKWHEECNGPS